MPLPQTSSPLSPHDRVALDPPADELRRAVLAELVALAGRAGVDTDRGTWAALQPQPEDDPDGTRGVRRAA